MVFTVTGTRAGEYAGADLSIDFEITGLSVLDITGTLTVTEVVDNPKGTILFGTGGNGTTNYGEHNSGGGGTLITRMANLGWRCVDRKWDSPWWQDGTGTSFLDQAERYAQLADWVFGTKYPLGKHLATANSGGASEIGYYLCHYGGDAYLDGCIMTAGPVFARLDYLDEEASMPSCPGLVPYTLECGAPLCGQESALLGYTDGQNAATLVSWSILNGSEKLYFPKTKVVLAGGLNDCTTAWPQLMLFYNAVSAVTPGVRLVTAPATQHWGPDYQPMRAVLEREFEAMEQEALRLKAPVRRDGIGAPVMMDEQLRALGPKGVRQRNFPKR